MNGFDNCRYCGIYKTPTKLKFDQIPLILSQKYSNTIKYTYSHFRALLLVCPRDSDISQLQSKQLAKAVKLLDGQRERTTMTYKLELDEHYTEKLASIEIESDSFDLKYFTISGFVSYIRQGKLRETFRFESE